MTRATTPMHMPSSIDAVIARQLPRLCAAAMFVAATTAAAQDFACLPMIDVDAGTVDVADLPEGAQALMDRTSVPLSGSNLFDGPPREGAALVPTSTAVRGKTATWVLDMSNERGYWMSCDYAGGLIRVIRRASDAVRQCEAKTRPLRHGRLSVQFTCTK